MPAWWGKKSTKVKDPQSNSPNSSNNSINYKSDLIKNGKKKTGREKLIRNFDEGSGLVLSRSSPRKSLDFGLRGGVGGEGSSGFSGFDSPSSSDIVYPLPKPANDHHSIHGGVFGLGSGSVSVSSVSSSGSCDDHPHHDPGQPCPSRGQYDARSSPLPSPGPASRGNTTTSSPLHPRLAALSLDSSSGRLDDWRSECHLLPLPPGSPTSPPTLPNPPRTPAMLETSTSLSRWKKGRLLGRGTFGHVYVGFNSDNGQMCAIKEVRVVADDQSSKECLKQLNQEITLLSQLSHPNIVQYYGSEMSEESLGVYLEYVSGGSIHKLLQEYGAFREPVIQNYTRQILSGLAYLHGRSTVHRDIKGANILVGPNGEVKLADFGMAKLITSAASMLSFKGSPYWMAPEVVMNTNGYNLTVDIWSLGCTILEMATSKPPWHQFEGVAAIFKIGNSKDMPDIPDHLSSEAKSFIRLCLQRDPMRRPSAAQLLDHPFVRDQTTTSGANVNITKQAFPKAFGGSRTPTALEMRGVRNNVLSFEGEVAAKPNFSGSRSLMSPRSENVRTITSLPVSPSSSPLRQQRSEPVSCLVSPQRSEPVSCLVSPQHPSFPSQSGFTTNDQSIFMMRPNITRTMLDPWLDAPQSRAQIPNIFPRTRPIL